MKRGVLFRRVVFALCVGLVFSGYSVSPAGADSPDNLNVFWGRFARDKTPLYAQPSRSAAVVMRGDGRHPLSMAGSVTKNGETWYEVVLPKKGWLHEADAWFSPSPDQTPDGLSMSERLAIRLAIDWGNYPKKAKKLLGRPKSERFVRGRDSVAHVLTWPGLIVRFENSFKKEENAWIDAATESRPLTNRSLFGRPSSFLAFLG